MLSVLGSFLSLLYFLTFVVVVSLVFVVVFVCCVFLFVVTEAVCKSAARTAGVLVYPRSGST